MGILNVTPDSFSDGGRYATTGEAVDHGVRLLDEGADILDIGGESTRPPGKTYGTGAAAVDAAEELSRVVPVIERIVALRPSAIVSIDTTKRGVAAAALAAGARIVNDVGGGEHDPAIIDVAARHDAPLIVMHGHPPGERRPIDAIVYDDVVGTVRSYLAGRIEAARASGVRTIIIDPGIGFGKRPEDSERLIRELSALRGIGAPILVGASRKAFIGRRLNGAGASERLFGSIAAAAAASLNGASIVRVHDVRPTVEFFMLFSPLIPHTETGITEDFGEDSSTGLSS